MAATISSVSVFVSKDTPISTNIFNKQSSDGGVYGCASIGAMFAGQLNLYADGIESIDMLIKTLNDIRNKMVNRTDASA